MDTAQPSTNGVSVSNLFRLGGILCDDNYTHLAKETVHAFEVEMLQHPWLFPTLLSGVVTTRLGGKAFLVTGSGGGGSENAAPLGNNDTTNQGQGTEAAGATMTQLFTRPRAGSRSIIQVSASGDSWLKTRNASLRDLLEGQPRQDGEQGGVYVLEKGRLRRGTVSDVREETDETE